MTHKGLFFIFSLVTAMAIMTPLAKAMPAVDHTIYGELLKSHVKNGQVDYKGFKEDEPQLDQYLNILQAVDPQQLSRPEKMAFFINAYNAWTIKLILNHYPGVKSIKELGSLFQSPWKKKFVKIHTQTVSLDHIEHDILRPVFKDPRIHFAVNCASKSCPPLLNEPFTGKNIEHQLDRVTKSFINDPQSNYVENGILYVSRVFKWFGEDFGNDILGYVQSHAGDVLAEQITAPQKKLKVKYLDYDWSLNGK